MASRFTTRAGRSGSSRGHVGRADESNGSAATAMPSTSDRAVRDLASVFKLLSDETRLRILLYLAQDRELHVSELCRRLGQGQPAISHHLALLRVSGLIEPRREGKFIFYRVRGDHLARLLADLLGAAGPIPKEVRFHQFLLTRPGS